MNPICAKCDNTLVGLCDHRGNPYHLCFWMFNLLANSEGIQDGIRPDEPQGYEE